MEQVSQSGAASPRVSLSVIVTSYESPRILAQCLSALAEQAGVDEVIVADCSREDPTPALHAAFPRAKVLHFSTPSPVPKMRWAALTHTTGRVIAAIEGRCVPASAWAADLIRAHERYPDAPAVGGPVALPADASVFDWGLYWSEFGAFVPPVPESEAARISGANLSYKRAALEACRDLLDAGVWETIIHDRWVRSGQWLRLCPATVTFHNGMSVGAAFAMRFHYGRSYAAERFRDATPIRRLVYGAGAPILPVLMVWRTARVAHARRRASAFWKAIPWVLALDAAWSAGELVGYLVGPSRRAHIY